MSLSDLSASELARIDAVCLDYESNYRRGNPPSISELVARHGGAHAKLLERELELVRQELENNADRRDQVTDVDPDPIQPIDSVKLPTPGTKIGPYVVGQLLGRGGMGVVFAAVDTRLDRRVAIKMLSIEIATRRDLTERFDREARAVAALSHPNIVELFDVGVAEGHPYAVMEYLDGELLESRFRRGPLGAEEVRRIGAQIADALATAHEANVIHRDLKPRNIMLVPRSGGDFGTDLVRSDHDTPSSQSTIVKLFDFGLSRAPDFSIGQSIEETGDGVILGTPGYMAPEQVCGEAVTPAADIFSLGCVLFEAFYGKRAFDGRTKTMQFSATLKHHPQPDPTGLREDEELAGLIGQCLQKDAGKRPGSAAQIAGQLRRGSRSAAIGGQRSAAFDSRGELTRRRWFELAGGGLVGAAAGVAFPPDLSNELANVDSIAVLSFSEESSAGTPTHSIPPPIGEAKLGRGDRLSALLVHELSRMSNVAVPRFRPMMAATPSEFREIGKMLEVDALVTGSLRTVHQGTKQFSELDIEIVSAKTGTQLWGNKIRTEAGDNLLEQSKLATEIAAEIGQRLTSTADEASPPNIRSFSCLVDGKTRSDPDSIRGLEMALECFNKAHEVDGGFADPIAGIALTSITLAAQSSTERSVELIQTARQHSEEALNLDPRSIDARLAEAMLLWQTVGRYTEAEQTFAELINDAPNHWQVRHQYGLLQLATSRSRQATQSLREASQLNPMSVLAKVDRARAEWYNGNERRAIEDAIRIRDRHDNSVLARGLLVDVYEQQGRFGLAAAEDGSVDPATVSDAAGYFHFRRDRLSRLPYGAFGEAVNAAILQSRTGRGIDDPALAGLTDPMPPMLPLLLAVHPGFASARMLPRAAEILPPGGGVL